MRPRFMREICAQRGCSPECACHTLTPASMPHHVHLCTAKCMQLEHSKKVVIWCLGGAERHPEAAHFPAEPRDTSRRRPCLSARLYIKSSLSGSMATVNVDVEFEPRALEAVRRTRAAHKRSCGE